MPDINVLEIARDDVVPNFQSCAYNLNSGRPDPRGTDPFGSLPITTERINCVQFTYAVLWKIMDLHFELSKNLNSLTQENIELAQHLLDQLEKDHKGILYTLRPDEL